MSDLFSNDLDGAALSADGVYRYRLWRSFTARSVVFCMLNPSTADASEDDPTIRRCRGFTKTWGYDGFVVINLFAFRATDPLALQNALDPVGPANDGNILRAMRETGGPIVCAWGRWGRLHNRDRAVMRMFQESAPVWCLGTNKDGTPKHPLYLDAKTPLQPYYGRP